MSQHIQAIFEGGLLRPLEPLNLREQEVVVLSIETTAEPAIVRPTETMTAEQKQAVLALLDEMERLPETSPADGFSRLDHDRVIYGIK
jgi:predicted DNA-binding antitoxin AbrB/MazE fold protein